MSTITKEFTKEQLIEHAKYGIERYSKAVVGFPRHLNVAMDLDLARIALASLEAEPDYMRYDCGCCGWEAIEDWRENDVCPKCNHHPMGKTPLYIAPPAPVSVPDEWKQWIADAVEYLEGGLEADGELEAEGSIEAKRLLARRAALLQSFGNSEQLNSPAIPDSWVLVPVEPTEKMINAWLSEVANWRGHVAGYRAMLSAAPQQEVK